MPTKYIARLDGNIIGRRASKDRTYSHAVIIRLSEEHARCAAFCYKAAPSDRRNYDYYANVALGLSPKAQTEAQKLKASVLIEGGFTAYVERIRMERVRRFHQMTFEPTVLCWCGRPDLAAREAKRAARWPRIEKTWIVDAEIET